MKFVRTLNQVQYSENTVYGNRACDLALLASERVPVPPTFVLTCDAWELFLKDIQYKADFIMQQTRSDNEQMLASAYNAVRRLFVNTQIPPIVLAELREAYESLGASVDIDEMTKEETSPFVTMMTSPDYVAEAESFEGIIQDIRTLEEVMVALKEIYAMQYTPEAVKYRKKIGVKSFRCAIILQAMPNAQASATAYSTDPEQQDMVFVHAYKGYTDLRDVVAKDFFHVKKEFLNITANQIVEQTKIITRDDTGKLVVDEFASRGQSMNDKDVMEVARLAKKSEKALGNPIKVFIAQANDFQVLFANRYDVPNRSSPERASAQGVGDMTVAQATAAGDLIMHEEALAQMQTEETEAVPEQNETEEQKQEDTVEEETATPVETTDDFEEEFNEGEDADDSDEQESEENTQEEFIEEESDEEPEEFLEVEEAQEDDEEDAEDADDSDEEYEYIDAEDDEETEDDGEEESDEDYEEDDSGDEYEENYDEEYEDEDSEESDDEEDDDSESDEEYEYIDAEDDETADESEEYEYVEEDADDSDEEYEDDEEPESDDEEYEYIDAEDGEEDDTEEYEESDDEEDTEEESEPVDEEPVETFIGDGEEQVTEEEPAAEETPAEEGPSQEDKDIVNKSVRIIYAELSKLYEKNGEQAPDTITELIQQGTQKGFFNINGLSEVLRIKRKTRTDEPISEEEKNLILEVVNQLVE